MAKADKQRKEGANLQKGYNSSYSWNNSWSYKRGPEKGLTILTKEERERRKKDADTAAAAAAASGDGGGSTSAVSDSTTKAGNSSASSFRSASKVPILTGSSLIGKSSIRNAENDQHSVEYQEGTTPYAALFDDDDMDDSSERGRGGTREAGARREEGDPRESAAGMGL